jgi:hypothetical protein
MLKRTLVRNDTMVQFITDNQQSAFIQVRNKLVASAKKNVKTNGLKNNIIGMLSKNDYTAPDSLLRGGRGLKNTLVQRNHVQGSNTIYDNTIYDNTIHYDNIIHGNTKQSSTKQSSITTLTSSIHKKTSISSSTIHSTPAQNITKVDIFTPVSTASFARLLATAFANCGIKANIFTRLINNADIAVCAREKGRYLLILSPQSILQAKNEPSYPDELSPLPANKYFLYQFENLQTKNPRNVNPNILELIKNATHTFECSNANMGYYPKDCRGQVSVLSPQNTGETIKRSLTIKMLYPALFHKYVLGLRNPNENLILNNYSVIKVAPITRKNLCHIHCLYLKYLDSMFANYISLILQTFDIIVTYTHPAEESLLNKYNTITFLRVNNYGMDIGPKFTVYEYLRSKNIDYTYVFYLHSKSNDISRNKYLMPFINNLEHIQSKLNANNANMTCYFHNVLWFGDSIHSTTYNKWMYNKLYMNDILHYLQIKHFKNDVHFAEGNFYILHKQIIDKLFSDKFLYNILNTGNSFDYNWVKLYYDFKNNEGIKDIYKVYHAYTAKKLFGNNLSTNKGHSGLADAMVEHVFERLPLTLCKEYGISINILDTTTSKDIFVGQQKQITQAEMQIAQLPITPVQLMHTSLNTSTKTLCIVACHTSSALKIKCLTRNKPYLEEIANDIIYINSSEFRAANVIENMVYIDNDQTICYGKYLHVLQNMDISQYDNVILTNDSYLITKSLSRFKTLFADAIEMSALCGSNESSKHYQDWLRRYNKVGIQKMIQYYKTNLANNKSFLSLIQNIELKSHLLHNNSINVLYDAIPGYKGNIHFDNTQLKDYLYNKNYPIIKIKKMQFTTYPNRQLPSDFNPTEYKSLHPDLTELRNKDAITHFINHGMGEGRPYKKGQSLIYADFLTQYLSEIKFTL